MIKRWLVVGDDLRMQKLAKLLAENNFDVYWHKTTSWGDVENDILQQFSPAIIILPVQPLTITTDQINLNSKMVLIVGKLDKHWQQQLQQITTFNYLEQEQFMWENAALTAEGIIACMYEQQKAIYGKKIYIAGFGRIAKMLAVRLQALKANVQIGTFKETELAEARAFGYEANYIIESQSTDAEIIINTIPLNWLTIKYEALFSLPIFDIASIPCYLHEVAPPNYQLLPTLPGRLFPEAAAEILYKTVLILAKEEQSC